MRAQIVSFHCILKNKLGTVLGSTFNQDVLTDIAGENTSMLKGLADGLKDLKKGEKRNIALTAKEAYGYYDLKKVIEVPRATFPNQRKLKVGDNILCSLDDGPKRSMRVIELDGVRVLLDGNHPLAGQDLIFEIEAIEAREATADEVGTDLNPEFTDLH